MIISEQILLRHESDPLVIQLKKSIRRRTWSIALKPGGEIICSVPFKMSDEKILLLLQKHEEWIRKKLKRLKSYSSMKLTHRWQEGENVYFQGKELRLCLERSVYSSVSVSDESLIIRAANFQPIHIKKIFEEWLALETQSQALFLLSKWTSRFELVNQPPLSFRTLKSCWGLCRSDGRITLHKHLARMHPEFFEYVLVHEMCHLFHMNHSSAFKQLLKSHIPHWKEIKKKHEPLLEC